MPITTRALTILEGDAIEAACTLPTEALPARLDDWDALLARARARTPLEDGLRIELAPTEDPGAVAGLAAAEQQCCPFFRFALTIDERGVALEVRWPRPMGPAVAGMFPAD